MVQAQQAKEKTQNFCKHICEVRRVLVWSLPLALHIFSSLLEWLEQVHMLFFILFFSSIFHGNGHFLSLFFFFFYNIRSQEACLEFWGLKEMWYPLLLFMFNFYWDWKWAIEELGTSFKQYLEAIPLCSLLWCIWNTFQALETGLLLRQKLGKQNCSSSLFFKFTSQFRLLVSSSSPKKLRNK